MNDSMKGYGPLPSSRSEPVPVTILTGFLGAGKTTLLNRLLTAAHGRRFGVIVNDFGAINIDERLVDSVEGEAMSLTNGCVCCSMRGGLVTTVVGMLSGPRPPHAIVVEASGIADPTAIAAAFRTPRLRECTRLDAVITVVDAENARNPRLDAQLIQDQIRTADVVVLNKSDLVSSACRHDLVSWIRTLAPASRVLQAIQGNVPTEILVDVHADARARPEFQTPYDHTTAFTTWTYSTAQPLAYRQVRAVLETLPVDLFRAKGILHLADAPNLRFVAQVVGRRVSIEPDGPWSSQSCGTDLVFIGSPHDVNPTHLAAALDACITKTVVLMSQANFSKSKGNRSHMALPLPISVGYTGNTTVESAPTYGPDTEPVGAAP